MHILIIFVLLVFIYKFSTLKIHIDFKSFFKRGFKKKDNQFRSLLLHAVNKANGKTFSCIKFLIEQKLRRKYKIITNVKSFKLFSDTLFFEDINDIIDYCTKFKDNEENVIIFFDEIFTILEKRTPMNKKILSFISQLRKRKIVFVTTAQEWAEINITFRRYCRYQIDCNMFSFPITKTAFIYNIINDGDKIKWDNDSQEFLAPRVSANFAKCPRSIIESYDTYETINVK